MALLSMTDAGESLIPSINPDVFVLILLVILSLMLFGMIFYLIIELISLLEEKRKYYQKLNKKQKEE